MTGWLLGVAVGGVILAAGGKALRRLLREAVPASERVQMRVHALALRLQMKSVPAVFIHRSIHDPCLFGVFRPTILLPACWLDACRADLLDSILAHELAHARRLDHVVNFVRRLVEMLLFFHPGVHWLSRSLRRHREFCADSLAVGLTGDPLALAGALESAALLRRGLARVPAGAARWAGSPVPFFHV